MSNNISFVGRLGGEPELKEVGGTSLLTFSIANNVGFGDRKITNWFRANIWGKQADSLQNHLSKGKQIFVTGELSINSYEKDGETRYSNDIRVNNIDFVSGGDQGGENSSSAQSDDDIPF